MAKSDLDELAINTIRTHSIDAVQKAKSGHPGSPHKVDTPAAHGEALGEEEVRPAKRAHGWPEDARFLVPDGVREHFDDGIGQRGAKARAEWEAPFATYATKFPDLAREIDQMQKRDLPEVRDRDLPSFPGDAKGVAGRDALGLVLNALARNIPRMIGGPADLGSSSNGSRPNIASRCCPRMSRRGSRSNRDRPLAGSAMSGSRERSSA